MKIGEITPQNMRDLRIWQIFSCLLYIILALCTAKVIGIYYVSRTLKRDPDPRDVRAWIGMFSEDRVNFIRAWLDNGCVVIGTLVDIQPGTRSLGSEGRGMVLESPAVIGPDGVQQDSIAERIRINTRDVKILEIATAEPSAVGDTEGDSNDREKANTKSR